MINNHFIGILPFPTNLSRQQHSTYGKDYQSSQNSQMTTQQQELQKFLTNYEASKAKFVRAMTNLILLQNNPFQPNQPQCNGEQKTYFTNYSSYDTFLVHLKQNQRTFQKQGKQETNKYQLKQEQIQPMNITLSQEDKCTQTEFKIDETRTSIQSDEVQPSQRQLSENESRSERMTRQGKKKRKMIEGLEKMSIRKKNKNMKKAAIVGKTILYQNYLDSKNIPKNYCKAIIKYILKNEKTCNELFNSEQKVKVFFQKLRQQKNNLVNIRQFYQLITDKPINEDQKEQNKIFRILRYHCLFVYIIYNNSSQFLRKYSINYIFNSKIRQVSWHLKYRLNIFKALCNPESFNQIKNI